MSSSSEMKENRNNCVRKYVNKLPWSEHSRARGLAFRIKMASPQKLLNISQCLSYSEVSGQFTTFWHTINEYKILGFEIGREYLQIQIA